MTTEFAHLAVKETLTLQIHALDEKISEKFHAIDKATDLAREDLNGKLIAMNATIQGRFDANKDLVDQLAKANAVALSAALQTQKESAAKSELAMVDLIKQLQTSFTTANLATNEKIDRLTSRLDLGDGRIFAGSEGRRDNFSFNGQTLLLIAVVISFLGLLIGASQAFLPHVVK
jgi:hypothetical protein